MHLHSFISLTLFLSAISSVLSAPLKIRRRDLLAPPSSSLLTSRDTQSGDLTLKNLLVGVASDAEQWTTLTGADGALPLSEATLRSIDVDGNVPPKYGTFDGHATLDITFLKGSYRLDAPNVPKGGVSFYAPGPAKVNLQDAEEVVMGYSVYFPTGFEFVDGGKLPGLCECPFRNN